jgi:hypothetical protein
VGRHSAPDPEDAAGQDVPEEPPTQRFGRQRPKEPDHGPGYGEQDYRGQGHRGYDRPDYREPAYPPTDYPEGDYDEPGYDEAGYGEPGYDEPGYGDAEYDESDYPHPELDGDYAQPESRRGGAAAPPPRSTGPQHGGQWDGGEWTGSHRAVQTGRRGVSVGVIAALVAVVVVVGAFILWRFFGDALSHRTDALASRCVDG